MSGGNEHTCGKILEWNRQLAETQQIVGARDRAELMQLFIRAHRALSPGIDEMTQRQLMDVIPLHQHNEQIFTRDDAMECQKGQPATERQKGQPASERPKVQPPAQTRMIMAKEQNVVFGKDDIMILEKFLQRGDQKNMRQFYQLHCGVRDKESDENALAKFEALLTHCQIIPDRKTEGNTAKGRTAEEIELMRRLAAQRKVVREAYNGQFGNAHRAILEYAYGVEAPPVPQDRIKEKVEAAYECDLEYEAPTGLKKKITPRFPEITVEAVAKAISALPSGKAAGMSGIAASHLKYLNHEAKIAHLLCRVFNTLLNEPRRIPECHALYRLRPVLIPKKSKGEEQEYRLISIPETSLKIFHWILKEHLNERVQGLRMQYAFTANGQLRILQAVTEARKYRDRTVTTIDIKNAFNSVPFALIRHTMEQAEVAGNVVEYIMRFLAARYYKVGDGKEEHLPCGVPQGDALSMQLFCLAIQPVLEQLRQDWEDTEILAYADDITVIHPRDVRGEDVIARATELLAEIGLRVNEKKCESAAEEDITVLGYPFSYDSNAKKLSDLIHEKIQSDLEAMKRFESIPKHAMFQILKHVVIPRALYAPFIDQDTQGVDNGYVKVDEEIRKYVFSKLLEERVDKREPGKHGAYRLLLESLNNDGLDLILPGAYAPCIAERQLEAVTDRNLKRSLRKLFHRNETSHARPSIARVVSSRGILADRAWARCADELLGYEVATMQGVCPGCQKTQTDLIEHQAKCSKTVPQWVTRHNALANTLLQLLDASRFPRGGSAWEGANGGPKVYPDIVLQVKGGNKPTIIDVVFSQDPEGAFRGKVRKYKHLGPVIPVVVNTNGTMLEKSRDLIKPYLKGDRNWNLLKLETKALACCVDFDAEVQEAMLGRQIQEAHQ